MRWYRLKQGSSGRWVGGGGGEGGYGGWLGGEADCFLFLTSNVLVSPRLCSHKDSWVGGWVGWLAGW